MTNEIAVAKDFRYMTKYYCDNCQMELLPNEGNRIIREKITDECRIKIEIMVAVNGVWNSGTLCNRCILLVVNDGKDTL